MTADKDLFARIERLESLQAIEQLPIRYALAVDGRDLDGWVALFIEDVRCGRHGTGRTVLRGLIEPQLRQFYRSIHRICGHRIDLDDADHAHGVVYCGAEHEVGGEWVVMAIAYFDDYARRDGQWYFVRRREKHWYSLDIRDRPAEPFHRWPDNGAAPQLPASFTTWLPFWADSGDAEIAALTSSPVEG